MLAKTVYLGAYDVDGTRHASPAGVTMMKYMLSVLSADNRVTMIAPSFPKDGKAAPRDCRCEEGYDLIFPASLKKSRNPLMRVLRQWHHRRALQRELEVQVQDGDTLVVYHSLLLMQAVKRLRRRRDFRLILQVCEIYADVNADVRCRAQEVAFVQTADAYVFMTEMMAAELNKEQKPYAVCNGSYAVSERVVSPSDDGKIHCVYAGTFDPRKGGVSAAIAAAAFLPSNYHLHVLGFGTPQEIEAVQAQVRACGKEGCTVSYDGCLQGEEYTRFIQKCAIGLSTQNPTAAFNATSFPSKILAYMANGLRVVSIRIPAVTTSAVGQFVTFYDEQTPEAIAKAILQVDMTDTYDGQAVLQELNAKFTHDFRNLY